MNAYVLIAEVTGLGLIAQYVTRHSLIRRDICHGLAEGLIVFRKPTDGDCC